MLSEWMDTTFKISLLKHVWILTLHVTWSPFQPLVISYRKWMLQLLPSSPHQGLQWV